MTILLLIDKEEEHRKDSISKDSNFLRKSKKLKILKEIKNSNFRIDWENQFLGKSKKFEFFGKIEKITVKPP